VTRREGEIVRLRHQVKRLRDLIRGLEIGVEMGDVPLVETAIAVADASSVVVAIAAKADAFQRAEEDS
jgi:hypothetical protein